MNILKFNSNRTYTSSGQRIAAAVVDGRVHFVDIDRGINGVLAEGVEFSPRAILAAYDQHMMTGRRQSAPGRRPGRLDGIRLWDAGGEIDFNASYALRQTLEEAAKTVTPSAR